MLREIKGELFDSNNRKLGTFSRKIGQDQSIEAHKNEPAFLRKTPVSVEAYMLPPPNNVKELKPFAMVPLPFGYHADSLVYGFFQTPNSKLNIAVAYSLGKPKWKECYTLFEEMGYQLPANPAVRIPDDHTVVRFDLTAGIELQRITPPSSSPKTFYKEWLWPPSPVTDQKTTTVPATTTTTTVASSSAPIFVEGKNGQLMCDSIQLAERKEVAIFPQSLEPITYSRITTSHDGIHFLRVTDRMIQIFELNPPDGKEGKSATMVLKKQIAKDTDADTCACFVASTLDAVIWDRMDVPSMGLYMLKQKDSWSLPEDAFLSIGNDFSISKVGAKCVYARYSTSIQPSIFLLPWTYISTDLSVKRAQEDSADTKTTPGDPVFLQAKCVCFQSPSRGSSPYLVPGDTRWEPLLVPSSSTLHERMNNTSSAGTFYFTKDDGKSVWFQKMSDFAEPESKFLVPSNPSTQKFLFHGISVDGKRVLLSLMEDLKSDVTLCVFNLETKSPPLMVAQYTVEQKDSHVYKFAADTSYSVVCYNSKRVILYGLNKNQTQYTQQASAQIDADAQDYFVDFTSEVLIVMSTKPVNNLKSELALTCKRWNPSSIASQVPIQWQGHDYARLLLTCKNNETGPLKEHVCGKIYNDLLYLYITVQENTYLAVLHLKQVPSITD